MSLRSRGGLGGAIVSLLALAVLGWPILHSLNGPTVNLSWLVYALPLTVIGIALSGAFVARLMRNGDPQTVAAPARRSLPPGFGIMLGIGGLAVGGWMMLTSDRDARTYASDSSCRVSFIAESTSSGDCHVQSATITSAYTSLSRHRDYYVSLRFGDGSTANVSLARETSGDVYYGMLYHHDADATVQFFRNHVVKVTTASGSALTGNMPAEQRNFWGLIGIGAGILGIASAVRATFF